MCRYGGEDRRVLNVGIVGICTVGRFDGDGREEDMLWNDGKC